MMEQDREGMLKRTKFVVEASYGVLLQDRVE